jgi:hypothetical protein
MRARGAARGGGGSHVGEGGVQPAVCERVCEKGRQAAGLQVCIVRFVCVICMCVLCVAVCAVFLFVCVGFVCVAMWVVVP